MKHVLQTLACVIFQAEGGILERYMEIELIMETRFSLSFRLSRSVSLIPGAYLERLAEHRKAPLASVVCLTQSRPLLVAYNGNDEVSQLIN